MRTFILACAAVVFASIAVAQEAESKFADYDAFSEFVDGHMMRREFVPLLKRLGGSDEFTPEQFAAKDRQLKAVWRNDFTDVTVFNERDLGGGLSQEGRAYWVGTSYAYFYVLLHRRADALVVIQFSMNTSSQPIIDKF